MPRGIFLVFALVGLAMAGGPLFYYLHAYSWVADARGWPQTAARVELVDLHERYSRDSDGDGSTVYAPRIAYRYRVGDRTLTGERIWLTGNDFYNSRADAVAFVQDYAVGQRVPLSYDPQRPAMAALIVNSPSRWILAGSAVGLFWLLCTWQFRPWRREDGDRKRFGKCRSCGVRLERGQHMSIDQMRPVTIDSYDRDGMHRPRIAHEVDWKHSPCPRCGEREPLNSLRNNPGMLLFLIVFCGIWIAGLYLLFFL